MCGDLRPAFHAGLSVGRGTPVFGEAAGAVTSPGPGKGHVRALDQAASSLLNRSPSKHGSDDHRACRWEEAWRRFQCKRPRWDSGETEAQGGAGVPCIPGRLGPGSGLGSQGVLPTLGATESCFLPVESWVGEASFCSGAALCWFRKTVFLKL